MLVKNINDVKREFAKFLGATYAPESDEFEMYGIIESIEDGEDEKHFFTPEQMPFEFDYNWLMALTEKIESLGFEVFINGLYCNITEGGLSDLEIESRGVSTKKMAILDACTEFIENYNKFKTSVEFAKPCDFAEYYNIIVEQREDKNG